MVLDGVSNRPCPNCGGVVEWWMYQDGYAARTSGAKCRQCGTYWPVNDFRYPNDLNRADVASVDGEGGVQGMTDRLQSIRERWSAAEYVEGAWGAYSNAKDDIAYLLRLAEAGEVLAEAARGNLSGTVNGRPWAEHDCMCFGDNACAAHYLEKTHAAWRQAREGR